MNKKEILAKTVGRRKEAVAQVQLIYGNGSFIINNKPAQLYLQNSSNSIFSIKAPFEILKNIENPNNYKMENIDTFVKVQGGGLVGQAEAIKLGIAKAITSLDEFSFKNSLKKKGYLTQDSRVKERRKYGLRKARKAPQYNKR
uniref:Small ribosomal subunit protein uS9c n=1 Tax=Jenufa perforata TaxID=993091 RepID=A0A0S2LP14_9CHLO|nr:ribosomal protein S9 [Jenufa perforata]ALO62904.1 ribosomal protein S9 [Jenufa perforata]